MVLRLGLVVCFVCRFNFCFGVCCYVVAACLGLAFVGW